VILSAMFAATIMLADATPAAATAATAAAPAEAAKATKTEKPKMVCRTEAVTGSMFPKKTCYQLDDLAQRQQEERKNLQQMQNNLSLKGN
jgi:uncharacterized protein (DUF2147 family)